MKDEHPQDPASIDAIESNLRRQEEALPPEVSARLAAARRAAVARMAEQDEPRRVPWLGMPGLLPAGGLLAAGVAAAILWPVAQSPLQLPALDDNEMAAATEMEMLDEIELIAWLLEQDADVG